MGGLLRVPFFDDELLLSFLTRTARANGRRSFRGFCSDIGLDHGGIARGDETALIEAANALGMPAERLVNSAMRLDGKHLVYDGSRYPARQLRRNPARYCRECLREDDRSVDRMPGTRRYIRTLWAFECVYACALHASPLANLEPGRFSTTRFDIEDINATIDARDDAFGTALTSFEAFVAERVARTGPKDGFLAGSPLPVVTILCEQLGAAALWGRRFFPGSNRMRSRREKLARGFEVLEGGAGSIEALLDTIVAADGKRHPTGNELYGDLYTALRRRPEAYEAVEPVLAAHAMRTRPDMSPFTGFSASDQPTDPVSRVSIQATAAAADVPKDVLLAYLGRHLVECADQPDGYLRTDIARRSIAALSGSLTFGQACILLECSSEDLEGLVLAGSVVPVVGKAGLEANFEHTDRYLRGELLSFRRSLVVRAKPGNGITCPVRRAADAVGCELAEAVGAIAGDRVTRVHYNGGRPLFDGIEVDPGELRFALGLGERIGSATVRKRLSLCRRSLPSLVEDGTIRAYVDSAGGTTFSERDVQSFDRKYASLRALAAEYCVTVERMGYMLSAAGITPEFSQDAVGVAIFRRSSVRAAIATDAEGDICRSRFLRYFSHQGERGRSERTFRR